MLISVNPEPHQSEFQVLLDFALNLLKEDANKNQTFYLGLLGNKLETKVLEILNFAALGTVFEGSIELISGQRFPDIVANKYYGVEVKTTKTNHWKSTGSSILEGTRVEGVERIFMLFGKMISPIDFMCKPYEECLSEVVVTHSPRYLIDMNIPKGQTIFDKILIPYDTLRTQSNPIKTVLDYYRKQLKEGDNVWYLDQDNSNVSNFVIKMWNNLTIKEREKLMIKSFCLFPELLGTQKDKFNRLSYWLAMRESVICPNVRDIFTAGGQEELIFDNHTFKNIPQICNKLFKNIHNIKLSLSEIPYDTLKECWSLEFDEQNRYETWVSLIVNHIRENKKISFPIEKILMS